MECINSYDCLNWFHCLLLNKWKDADEALNCRLVCKVSLGVIPIWMISYSTEIVLCIYWPWKKQNQGLVLRLGTSRFALQRESSIEGVTSLRPPCQCVMATAGWQMLPGHTFPSSAGWAETKMEKSVVERKTGRWLSSYWHVQIDTAWGQLVYCQLKPDGPSHGLRWGCWYLLRQAWGSCSPFSQRPAARSVSAPQILWWNRYQFWSQKFKIKTCA